jgi:hypothetical protein
MKQGELVDVTFFGRNSVRGVVEEVATATATIVFGKVVGGGWAVTIPRDWARRNEDRWLLDLG